MDCSRLPTVPSAASATAPARIRVLLGNDHSFLRRSLLALLEDEIDVQLVAQANDLPTLLQQVRTHRPDVLVIDLGLLTPGSGLATLRRLHADSPCTAIVVTSMSDGPEFARGVLNAGASGYVANVDAVEDLARAIRAVAGGREFVSARTGYADKRASALSPVPVAS
jgi:two-component system NarL family response regulator